MSHSRSHDVESLIVAHFDTGLSDSDQLRLAELLQRSSEARELFNSYMRLEGMAVGLGQANCLTNDPIIPASNVTPPTPRSRKRPPNIVWMRRILAGGLALALGIWIAFQSDSATDSKPRKPLPTVGHVSRIVAADWVSSVPELGGDVSVGSYQLKSGLVEFEFDNGATVILEGPARFDITSGERTFLHHGRVRTHVPPQAYGFTIDTTNMQVVDLGTEFGMEVDMTGAAEVHVFDGEVEIVNRQQTETDTRLLLGAGEAVRLDNSGLQNEIAADVDAFVDQATLESRAEAYLEDLNQQLERIDQRHDQLVTQLRRAESAAKRSPELQRLKQTAAETKERWLRRQEDPKLQSDLATRDQAKARLNALYRQRMEAEDAGKRLLDQLERADAALATSKARLAESRRDQKRAGKAPHQQLRNLQQERNRARAQVQAYRSDLRASDPSIREAVQQLAQARRQLESHLVRPEFAEPRLKAARYRKAFLAKQRQLLLNDEEIKALRADLSQTRQQARRLRHNIQQARQATNSLFAIRNEINVSSSEVE